MMPYQTYLRSQLKKYDFLRKSYFHTSEIDIDKEIKMIHDIHRRLSWLFSTAIPDLRHVQSSHPADISLKFSTDLTIFGFPNYHFAEPCILWTFCTELHFVCHSHSSNDVRRWLLVYLSVNDDNIESKYPSQAPIYLLFSNLLSFWQ